ncbi:hypothetical protein AA103196_1748 [Ameyamaea chiangmaiensis NBRC 103196]|nr:heparinase II/III family protein [Ameyamaea chiangmaiensis]GBQ67710.1 hypothetical protein AA103196_1748 [Ameyamaea chiangmaiensis NBRC 103196]
MRRLTREARVSLARLPAIGKVPQGPTYTARDLIPGDPARGVRLLRGELEIAGAVRHLGRNWEDPSWTEGVRAAIQGFGWLRDLAALGTSGARARARTLVADWLGFVAPDPTESDAPVLGERIASLLAHYDFYAASADEAFQHALMTHLMIQARVIVALLPLNALDCSALGAMRGLLAAAIAMPEHAGYLQRFLRYIDVTLERQILADGCLANRSPEAQFQAVRELTEMRIMFQTARLQAPESVLNALDRLAPVLRALRHGDGGLALFNGASEHHAGLLDTVLAQASRVRVVAGAMPNGGFLRVTAGRSLLLVDAGVPAPAGFDSTANAGTLSLEFSVGRQRIFCNCGASPLRGWSQMLRGTAAHSVMGIEDRSSSDFAPGGGLSRRPVHVTADHQTQGGAHWLDLSHDGYRASVGATYRRRLYLGADGTDLRGEEIVEGEKPVAMVLRFHLHPSVSVEFDPSEEEIVLRAGQGGAWRFVQDGGVLSVEDSVYFGGPAPVKTAQITITVRPLAGEPAPVEAQAEPTGPVGGEATDPVVVEGVASDPAVAPATPPGEASTPTARVPTDATAVRRPGARMTLRPVPQPGAEAARQVVRWVMTRIDTEDASS